MSTSPATSSPKSPAVSTVKPKKKRTVIRIAGEIIAPILWLAVLTKLFVFDFDQYLFRQFLPDYVWLLDYRFVFGLAAFAILLIVGRLWFKQAILMELGFVFAYPLVLLLRLAIIALYNWPIAIAFAPAIHALVISFPAILLCNSLAVLSGIAVVSFSDRYLLVAAMVYLAFFLVRHLWNDFRRAFTPSSVFSDLAGFVRKARAIVVDSIAKWAKPLEDLEPESDKYKAKLKSTLEAAYVLYTGLKVLSDKFRSVIAGGMLDVYLATTFVFTLLVTVLVYAFEYYALYKIDSSHFTIRESPNILDFLGFSLTTLVSGSVSPVLPSSGWAQAIAHSQVVCAMLLLVVAVSFAVTVLKQRMRDEIDRVGTEIDTTLSELSTGMDQHFHLSLDGIEQYLITTSLEMVNVARSIRGLAPIALHTSQANSQPPDSTADAEQTIPAPPNTDSNEHPRTH